MLCYTNMWDSVSRTLGYGWNVGFSVLQKVSEKIFDTTEEEDTSFVNDKMPEEQESKTQEFSHEQKPKGKTETEQSNPEAMSSVYIDSLDETSHKSSGYKKANRNNENHTKISFPKLDNRSRQKVSSDVRWNYIGNGSNDRWLGKSQSDLSTSKWFSNAANSVKSEFSHRSHGPTINSSESDVFPSRSGISTNPNETSNSRPHTLFKSSSSSQLPSVRGGFFQPTKQWKYGGSFSDRPMSVVSMQQGYMPGGLGFPTNMYSKSFCFCNDNCDKKPNRTDSVLSLAEMAETPEGLSWRRLHKSRAKLKATATTSELLSGFAMVAMVELQINQSTTVPEWLFVLFAVCTTILVSVHIFALMISTYILPNIDAVSKLHVSSLVTESPHDRMKSFIELAWTFSTVLGLFLFLVEIAILCWVKFWDYSITAAMSATMIIMPVLVLFVAFAMHFYHSLVVIKCKTSSTNMQELENMKRQLDNVSPA